MAIQESQQTRWELKGQEAPEADGVPAPLRRIRVLVTDEHPLVRDLLVGLLEVEDDIEVVGTADDGRTAIELVRACRPDVVLMDVATPGLSGIEATRQITREFPQQCVIGHSTTADEQLAELMYAAGAVAFFAKSGSIDELLAAIRGN